MASSRGPWIGRTGLRLALVFVGVAVVSVGTILIVAAATVTSDINRLAGQQQGDVTHALALAARDAYGRSGWTRASLGEIVDIVDRAGAAVQVRGPTGKVISATPRFASFPARPQRHAVITVRGKPVGSVTVKFAKRGLSAALSRFEGLRWQVRITGAATAILIIVVVSVFVSRWITAPIDRLTGAARAMAAGDAAARVGRTRGVSEIRELAAAFDQMAGSLASEARVRRTMVADIAHELKAPIAVVQAGSEAMLDGVTEPSMQNLGSLHEEAMRLGQMVDDLQVLAFAEVAALRLELAPHDLGAIAGQAADSLAESFGAAQVSLRRQLTSVAVTCDARRTYEIAVNLLTNAVKYTGPGGTVTLETGPSGRSPAQAMVRVTDTGVGIPAEDLPHVSERLFRGRRASAVPGSGIGLAIVEQLASAQHGRLEIASQEGAGTQVTVTLPMAGQRPV